MAILPQNRNHGKMVFSGPFQVSDFQEKQDEILVTITRNPWYLGKKSKIHTIYFHFYRDHGVFEEALQQGKPDIFIYNRRFQFPHIRYNYNYFKTPTFGGFYFKLNPVSGPFKNKELRKFFRDFILSYDFIKSQKWELTTPSRLVLPYNLSGYDIFNPITPGDFTRHIPSTPIKIRCVNDSSGIRKTLIPLLKEELKKYNLILEMEWDTITNIQSREKKGEVDMTAQYYVVDIPLSSYFYDTLFTPGHELNLFGYKNDTALQLLMAFHKEEDDLKRLKILSQLEQIAQEECILIPLVNPLTLLGYKDHLKNVSINKFLSIDFSNIEVTAEK